MLDLSEVSELFTGPLMSQNRSVLQEVRIIKVNSCSKTNMKFKTEVNGG